MVASGNLLFVGTDNSEVFILDKQTVEVQGVLQVGGKVVAAPVVKNGTAYVASWDRKLYAFDVESQEPLWVTDLPGKVDRQPLLYNNMLILGATDGSIASYNVKDGSLEWQFVTSKTVSSCPA